MAQNGDLLQRDLSTVTVERLSDEQIIRFIKYADNQGLTDQQVEAAALARNMAPAEVDKLMSRIRRLRSRGETTQRSNNVQKLSPADSLEQQSRRDTSLRADLTEEEKKVFGYELFNSENLTFEPSLNIATPENYQVGSGDELLVNIWGASRQTYTLEVRSG